LIFTDDDCTFDKDWLTNLTKYIEEGIGAVGGPDMANPNDPFIVKCVDYVVTSLIGTGGVRRKEKRIGKYYPRGFNMAVPKKVIEEIGGFDENFKAGEDIDLSYRIKEAGYILKYTPDAWVWHKRRGTIIGFIRQIFTRGYTRTMLIRKHKDLLEPAYLITPSIVLLLPCLIVFSLIFPPVLKISISLSVVYLFILLFAGIHSTFKMKNIWALVVVPFLLFLQHITYGIGFLWALSIRSSEK
jgi:GT2 family glycosyltransferase